MSILTPFLIGRAVGGWRYMRAILLLVLVGCAIVGVIYAVVVFNAVRNTPENQHVQPHSAH